MTITTAQNPEINSISEPKNTDSKVNTAIEETTWKLAGFLDEETAKNLKEKQEKMKSLLIQLEIERQKRSDKISYY